MSHQITAIDMAAAGFGPQYAGTKVPGYVNHGPEAAQWVKAIDPNYVFDNEDTIRLMVHAWTRELSRPETRHRKGVYLHGPTGSGKTSVVEQFFARLGVPVVKITWQPRMEAAELITSKTLVDGSLLNTDQALAVAARFGYPVLIDEIDLGDPAEKVALNEVIERGLFVTPEGTTFVAERGFVVFATGNTAGSQDLEGNFHGTMAQNAAFLRRFFSIQVGYADQVREVNFLRAQCPGVADGVLVAVARAATMLRQAYEGNLDGQRLSASLSRPETVDWVETMARFHYLGGRGVNVASYALGFVFTNRLLPEDRQVADQIVASCFGVTP